MLWRLGLVTGFAAGAVLGGPWAFFGSITGLGIGSVGDLMLIRLCLHDINKNAERWVHVRELELHKEGSVEV
jgi:hypothetical protein